MKTEKIRRIELKDPDLRRIRKNLRDIIKLAVTAKINKLQEEEIKLVKKTVLTLEEKERKRELSFRHNQLRHLLSNSIIQCSTGAACDSHQEGKKQGFNPRDRRTDLDMVWVPEYQKWFCTKCYEHYYKK